MKKEMKKQIKAAIRLTRVEEWNAIDGVAVDIIHRCPMAWIRGSNARRAVIAAAYKAVKAFAVNPDGSFRRGWAFRAAARRHLAEVIFKAANE